MKSLMLTMAAAGLLASGASFAQNTQGTGPGTTRPMTTAPQAPSGSVSSARPAQSGTMTASGNNNQAVATTDANALTPAKGANSFTMSEAKGRLEKNGFSNVGGLTKDSDGVWRGNAQKGGTSTTVWLDYKGNTGTGK